MYSCGFRAFLFICGSRRFSFVTHTVTHTGFGRAVFGRLVCSLFYAEAFLFRSALYGRLGILALTFVQKCPSWRSGRLGWRFSPLLPFCGRFRADLGLFSLKRNDWLRENKYGIITSRRKPKPCFTSLRTPGRTFYRNLDRHFGQRPAINRRDGMHI